jgi:hypothetical protein
LCSPDGQAAKVTARVRAWQRLGTFEGDSEGAIGVVVDIFDMSCEHERPLCEPRMSGSGCLRQGLATGTASISDFVLISRAQRSRERFSQHARLCRVCGSGCALASLCVNGFSTLIWKHGKRLIRNAASKLGNLKPLPQLFHRTHDIEQPSESTARREF